MNISTKHNIGDKIVVAGIEREIIALHIYESKEVHAERYYLGQHDWVTSEGEEVKI